MLDTQKDLYYIMEDMFEDMVSDGIAYFFNDKGLRNDLSKMNDFNSFRDIYYKLFVSEFCRFAASVLIHFGFS